MIRIDEEAVDWAARVADRDFTDWDAFTMWLEADPTHAARYDAAVVALDRAESAVEQLPAGHMSDASAPKDRTSGRSLRWAGGAIAAALAGVLGVTLWPERAQPYAVETAAGESRVLALGEGSSIVLAGGSRVLLNRAAPRQARVERGEALFQVRHDAEHPFHVSAGGLALVDVGTVFNVKRAGGMTRVAVAEGAVLVDPEGASLRLNPGETVTAVGDRLTEGRIPLADVAAWRDGRLAYDGAALDEVAGDLARQIGLPVRVEPALARRPFRGTLDIASLRGDPTTLGALLDVHVRVEAGGWTLEPRE